MRTESKVIKAGDDLLVRIPAHLAEKLALQEGTTLFIDDEPYGFLVSPFPDEVSRQMHIAEQIMQRDRDLLRRLANS